MFIAVEGMDGSGKSTQTKMLAQWLKKQGYEVFRTREPTQGDIGSLIREILKDHKDIEPKALTYLFLADRIEHAKQIERKLSEGKIVICDRYMLSTLAYQSAQGIELEWLKDIHKGILLPDITFLLDVDPEISMKRLRSQEKFENIGFQEKVRQAYLFLAKQYKDIHVLDTCHERIETHKKMVKFLANRLPEVKQTPLKENQEK